MGVWHHLPLDNKTCINEVVAFKIKHTIRGKLRSRDYQKMGGDPLPPAPSMDLALQARV